jgi:hypothetical protein
MGFAKLREYGLSLIRIMAEVKEKVENRLFPAPSPLPEKWD